MHYSAGANFSMPRVFFKEKLIYDLTFNIDRWVNLDWRQSYNDIIYSWKERLFYHAKFPKHFFQMLFLYNETTAMHDFNGNCLNVAFMFCHLTA